MNEQIQNIIAVSNTFLILSDKKERPEIFLAREALRLVLEASGKHVLSYPELPNYFSGKFQSILPGGKTGNFSHVTLISMPKELQIEEVYYEEGENNFLISVNSKSKIEEKDITIEKKPARIEAMFLFTPESDIQDLQSNFELPLRERRINIVKNHITISQKIFELTKNFDLDSARKYQFATLLYAALIYETKNFQNIADAEVFNLAKNLLSLGAAKEKISEIFNSMKEVSFSRILGRALARTHVDRQTSSSWTFITREDVEKSGLKSSDFIPEILFDALRDNIPKVKITLVFFEEPPGVRCFVESQEKHIIEKFAKVFHQGTSGDFVYSKKFENFTKAETELKELLKKL